MKGQGKTILLLAIVLIAPTAASADTCPPAKDVIATDGPDVTNSSLVVPTGSLQNENGVNFSIRDDGRPSTGRTAGGDWALRRVLSYWLTCPPISRTFKGPALR